LEIACNESYGKARLVLVAGGGWDAADDGGGAFSLAVFGGPAASEHAQALRVEDEGLFPQERSFVGVARCLDLGVEGGENFEGVRFPFWLEGLPFAPLLDLVAEDRDEDGFVAGGVIDGDDFVGDCFQEADCGCDVVEEGVGFAERARRVEWRGADVVDEGGNEPDGLGRCDGLGATEVEVSTGRREPLTKRGGAIVHSVVVAVSNDASVCRLEKVDARVDKSSGGRRHIRKGRRVGQLAITAAHDGDFSQRDKWSASTLRTPLRCRGWSCTEEAGKGWDKKAVRRRASWRTGGRLVRAAYRSQESADVLSAQTRIRCPPAGMAQAGAALSSVEVGLSWYAKS